MHLSSSFYSSNDVLNISKKLLGKILSTNINNEVSKGIIVEVEAYLGKNDKASHAYNNKRTQRTEPMFNKGGYSYIYLCYGVHNLFNIVVGSKDNPLAILVRAIEPIKGHKIMLSRRNLNTLNYNLTNGPGKLTQALGIDIKYNNIQLNSKELSIENSDIKISKKDIFSGPRIGVDYAKEDSKLPYRFYIKDNKWVSKSG